MNNACFVNVVERLTMVNTKDHLTLPSHQSYANIVHSSIAILFVCYFVFDWWGVSTAIQIRLYAGLLSVLPLNVCGMSLHMHGVVTEND